METFSAQFIVTVVLLALALAAAVVLAIRAALAYRRVHTKYKGIIDVDAEIVDRQKEHKKLVAEFQNLDSEYQQKSEKLNSEYQSKRAIYEELLRELSVLEEDLELTTFGVYKPHFDYDTSEDYKNALGKARGDQKQMIKGKSAIVCEAEWTVGGSKREGQKMTKQYMQLMLRAFNNECDAAVLKVKWNNIQRMEERIQRAFDAINKLGATHHIEITADYLQLKMKELRLAHEYQEKRQEEKEEQRRIREQMREEEKVQREIEEARKEAEGDERRYQASLDRARKEMEAAQGTELDKLNEELEKLQRQLREAHEKKERSISRAQQTKSGHVYVISNVGSFGDTVYKIGMTRRLEPADRVKELGDASVPFGFDVHAMIFSENAPQLEAALHKEFDKLRVNLVNTRKEFFRVSLDGIETTVKKHHGDIEFTKLAEAKEYRETVAVLEQAKVTVEQKVEERFPSTL